MQPIQYPPHQQQQQQPATPSHALAHPSPSASVLSSDGQQSHQQQQQRVVPIPQQQQRHQFPLTPSEQQQQQMHQQLLDSRLQKQQTVRTPVGCVHPGQQQVQLHHQPSFHELELAGVGHPHPHGQHLSHQEHMLIHHPQQQPQELVAHQRQHAGLRIEQPGPMQHMHPAPPAPPQLPQRIFIQQQQQSMMPQQVMSPQHLQEATLQPPPPPLPPHPHLYIGSQRFSASILAEMELQPNISPKQKYRDLKKKFKYLVYENEYYQEELRNLQRKLLKLSRDKNFLLDRLGHYEQLSESSDDSDVSTKTLEDRGVAKPKKKPKQTQNRKRAAPTTSGSGAAASSSSQCPPKRATSKNTPAKQKVSELSAKDLANQLTSKVEGDEHSKQDGTSLAQHNESQQSFDEEKNGAEKEIKVETKDGMVNNTSSAESSVVSPQ